MYWFILLFPLMIFPWGYDPIFTTPKYFYLQMFVFITWLFIIFKRKYQTIQLDKDHYKIEIIVSIFISLVCLSTVLSENPMTSIYGTENRSEGLFTFIAYGSILLFSYRFLKGTHLQNVIKGIVVVSVFVSIYGILQHYQLDFLPRSSGRIGYDRSYAFFGNPNFYGSYLVLIMMLGIALYLTAINKKTTLFYLTAVSLGHIALLFTGTRSGWLGVFCALLFLTVVVIFKRKNLWKKWLALFFILMSLTVIINLVEQGDFVNRFGSIISDASKIAQNETTGREGSSRWFIWENSLPLIKDYFWIGSGPDTFRYVFPSTPEEREQYLGNRFMIVDKAHNEYLQLAITLGVPALILYLSLIAFVIRKAFQAIRIASDNEKIILYGLLSAILGYLVQAFFNISVVSVAPFFWVLLGITLAKSAKCLKQNVEHYEYNSINKSA
jgi:O-antigen ligase